jgi:WD40 repeat protein
MRLWDVASGQNLRVLECDRYGYGVVGVAFSPDGKRIASGGLEFIDFRLYYLMTHGVDPPGQSSRENIRPARARIDPIVGVLDSTTGKECLPLRGHKGSVRCVAFSPDGKRIVSGSEDRTLKVWDAASGQEVLTLARPEGRITCVAFSPDGKRFVSGGGDTLRVWDTASGQETISLKSSAGSLNSVAFDSSGERIACNGKDGTIQIWNACAKDGND